MLACLFVGYGTVSSAGSLVDQGTETFDTETGLYWLDLTATIGLSPNQALATFVQYRLATNAEVVELFLNGGMTAVDDVARFSDRFAAQSIVDLLGGTVSSARTRGMTLIGHTNTDRVNWGNIRVVNGGIENDLGEAYFSGGYGLDASNIGTGSFLVRTNNAPPIADAGPNQSIRIDDVVLLDGSNSFDDNTATTSLFYNWSFTSLPQGSTSALNSATTVQPGFIADVAGTYLIQLIVTDEDGLTSTPDFVEISSDNLAPTAAISGPSLVVVGDTVDLDGSASIDPEAAPITYDWSFAAIPVGSTASLTSTVNTQSSFVADQAGEYTITLQVSDLIGPGGSSTLTVTAATPGDYSQTVITDAAADIDALPPGSVTTGGNQNALTNFLSQAVAAIQTGDIDQAVAKLEEAISRTDGCTLRGAPDGNGQGRDWIADCDDQAVAYVALTEALAVLQ